MTSTVTLTEQRSTLFKRKRKEIVRVQQAKEEGEEDGIAVQYLS